MKLLEPSLDLLPRYVEALKRGWCWNNTRAMEEGAREELEEIARDPKGFVELQVDREARGAPIALPDGSLVPRLPGYKLWMWEGDFCGSIHFRWVPGTSRLPPHVLGHIGYAVVPWMQRRGYGTRALALMRPRARAEGLAHVQITCDVDNVASAKVILGNGGVALERFDKPAANGGNASWRFHWYTGEPLPIEPETPRLRLRQWRESDREPWAAMNADLRVMEHFPKPLTREESDASLDRARAGIALRGFGHWAVERRDDAAFLGFVGVWPVRDEMSFAPAVEIGWRLARHAWGQGYATEAARESLRIAFEVLGLPRVVAYTAMTNEPSTAVMRRLGMSEEARFDHPALPEGHRLRPHRLFSLSSA